jgi:hypothetical protein
VTKANGYFGVDDEGIESLGGIIDSLNIVHSNLNDWLEKYKSDCYSYESEWAFAGLRFVKCAISELDDVYASLPGD